MLNLITKIGAFAVLTALLAVGAPVKAETIRVATEGAYAPYNFKDAAGNLTGFEVELYQELCKRMDIECTLVEQAWDGMIPALVAKKYDAIMAGMSATEEREKTISFSRSYSQEPVVFATMKGSSFAAYTDGNESLTLDDVSAAERASLDAIKNDLNGLTVGVQVSTTHEVFMNEYMDGVSLKSYDTMENMFLDLEAGRVDAAYTSASFLVPTMEKNPNIQKVGPDMTGGLLGRGVAVGIRQEDGALREKFSAAINSMIDDGSLKIMAVKWFGFDASARK